jgi:hypothetical protein
LEKKMKTTLIVLFLLCATAAFGQAAAGLNAEPQMVQFMTHPQHAAVQAMGQEQNLLVSSGYTSARGERPLWEVMVPAPQVPLGDTARILKQEHALAKKATIVWSNN